MDANISRGVNVRISGRLQHFVNMQVGPDGLYESVSEYVRELIRQDYERKEERKWQWLCQELSPGMQASASEFKEVSVEEVILRNLARGA